MNKLEVGMYVRTRKDGIGRIISFSACDDDECCFIKLSNRQTGIKEYNIIKASFNIIVLIEVGDIISYEFPTGLGMIGYKNVTVLQELLDVLQNGENNHEYKINSIVTKEQFERMEYKIGDSNE